MQALTDIARLLRRHAVPIALAGMTLSCASIGNLQGGPYDEDPPVFVGSTPAMGELNNTKNRIVIEFDEYIAISNASEKVVISPPQKQQPDLKASSKKVIVKLADTLKPNTTYTIDFGDAIQDNNEGNPLEQFVYTFSTGDQLDTMAISGIVLNAADLEPVKGMLVGLHSCTDDSAFTTLPFDRVGLTDSRGRFSVKGIAGGSYRVYALKDLDQDFQFSQPGEAIAFHDSLITPAWETRMRQDTVWVDSLTIDTIYERPYTHFLPDDILLRCFTEPKTQQRLTRSERLTRNKFSLYFSAPADTLPTLRGLNFDERDAFVIEQLTGRNDTIDYWVRDTLVAQMDTLKIELSYLYTDSTNTLVPRTDTLRLVSRERQKSEKELERERKAREKEEEKRRKSGDTLGLPEVKYLSMDVYAPTSLDIFDYLTLTLPEPILHINPEAISLTHQVDTLWVDVPFDLVPDKRDRKVINIVPRDDWEWGGNYAYCIDSAAVTGLYGLYTKRTESKFAIKKEEDYGAIFFDVEGTGDTPAFVELLTERDVVLRTVDVVDGKADFYFLPAGKYGARLIMDENGNRQWDTGLYAEKRQPEMVYYYWQVLELKANFELNQTWNILSRALEKQKPSSMVRQKPDEKKKTNRN